MMEFNMMRETPSRFTYGRAQLLGATLGVEALCARPAALTSRQPLGYERLSRVVPIPCAGERRVDRWPILSLTNPRREPSRSARAWLRSRPKGRRRP